MRALVLLTLMISLSACERGINITSSPIQIDIGRTADPSPVQMQPVTLRVVTKENLDAFLTEIRQQQGDQPVFIAIMSRDYENMVINLADLRRYIEQQQSVITYYRQLTAPRATN